MKSKKFTKVLAMFLCTVMVIMIFHITANADMGPKPSVRCACFLFGRKYLYHLSEQTVYTPAFVKQYSLGTP